MKDCPFAKPVPRLLVVALLPNHCIIPDVAMRDIANDAMHAALIFEEWPIPLDPITRPSARPVLILVQCPVTALVTAPQMSIVAALIIPKATESSGNRHKACATPKRHSKKSDKQNQTIDHRATAVNVLGTTSSVCEGSLLDGCCCCRGCCCSK